MPLSSECWIVDRSPAGTAAMPSFEDAVKTAEEMGIADHALPRLALAIGRRLGLGQDALDELRLVALVHDVGKLAIPTQLLNKRGSLTIVEWAVMQRHAMLGRRLIERSLGLERAAEGVGAVRERWDGSGYPLGLRGPATPLSARIVHVADAYDAMTSDRPYRRGMSHDEAIRVLEQYAGTQFDAKIVPVFTKLAGIARRERPFAGANGPEVRSLAEALNGLPVTISESKDA